MKEQYGTEDVQEAYESLLERLPFEDRSELPEKIEDPLPLRWCFRSPEEWCFVDADYATAEVFSIAYLAGDEGLIKRLTEPDPQFVLVKDGETTKPVRVAYVEGVTQFEKEEWDPDLVTPIEELGDKVVRDEKGKPVNPKRDVHWEMAEHRLFMNKPREKMSKSRERSAGKIGNFQIPYQSSPGLLNRLVELATGENPEESTGERLIQAYQESNPKCWEFLERVMEDVETKGVYVSPTGAKRHFHTHSGTNLGNYHKNSVLSGLRRQASNYPMQSLVGDTLARAVVWLIRRFREEGLRATVACPLYDALYCLCPISEKTRVQELMQECMSNSNYWDLPGGRLKFNLEFDITKRWSVPPDEKEKLELGID